jgi:hypothetical protein
VDATENTGQQRRAVADGEQRDVQGHVLQAIQKEDDAGEEQQVVVACDHVLGAEVHEREDVDTPAGCHVGSVAAGHAMRQRDARQGGGNADRQTDNSAG